MNNLILLLGWPAAVLLFWVGIFSVGGNILVKDSDPEKENERKTILKHLVVPSMMLALIAAAMRITIF